MYSEISTFLMLIKDSDRVWKLSTVQRFYLMLSRCGVHCFLLHFAAREACSCAGLEYSCPQQAKFD